MSLSEANTEVRMPVQCAPSLATVPNTDKCMAEEFCSRVDRA